MQFICFPKPRLAILFFFVALLTIQPLLAQQPETPSIFVKYTTEKITLDGVIDEPMWQTANKADNFWQFFPADSVKAKHPTEVRLLYSETALYVAMRADASSGDFVISSLRRDFSGTNNDNVTVVFDTYCDGTNAFMLSVSPYGVQREMLISDGGAVRENFNGSWDVKWQTEAKRYDDYYTIEMVIPFSSLKFPEGSQKWRFQTFRWNLQVNEQSAWARVPQNQLLANLAFMGELTFEKPLGKSRPPMYMIPYVNAIASRDYVADKPDANIAVGGDAKIAIGDGMNLDITVRPDFSNVEVDNIVTNLTRFEVSMPEKRQFFIDNNDLFANFGNFFNDVRPFFSRRIGLVTDTLGNTIENRIIGGVRLSGKIDKNWRLGVLNIQTAEDPDNLILSNNNAMIALQRKVFSRSNVGVFIVNRQTLKDYDFQEPNQKFNRVVGIDYNLASKSGKWTGKFYTHKSLQPDDTHGNLSAQALLIYNDRFWNIISDVVYIDKDFKADLGFVPRTDVFKSGNGIGRTFYSKSGLINKQTARVINVMFFKPELDLKKVDHFVWVADEIEFRNLATLTARYTWNYVYLTRNFDPTRTFKGQPLPAFTEYDYHQMTAIYTSNNTRAFSYTFTATAGQFFNGQNVSFSGTGNYRIIPWAFLSLTANYDRVRLPEPYSSADIMLISPKIDITFTKSLFWSTLIQYSNLRDNIGINSRLQWRFAPLSDLFLVYNDNYYSTIAEPKYRSINLKVSYWFNVSSVGK